MVVKSQLLENTVPYSQPGQGNLNANVDARREAKANRTIATHYSSRDD